MASVFFDPEVGGDGSTVTDDANPSTGLSNGGHRTRFVPALQQTVAVASNAKNSASAAAASAASALNAPGTSATSTDAITIGSGSKSLTIQTGKAFVPGMYLLLSATAGVWMLGAVSSYNSATGALVVAVEMYQGSGSYSAWTVAPTSPINPSTVIYALGYTPGNLAAVNAWQQKQVFNGGADFAGDLLFNNAGQRIKGDLSGALADRVYFQSSVSNATSTLGLLPNGSASGSAWVAFNGSNPAQASTAQLEINGSEMRISSARTGTASYLPMSFYTDGLQQMRLANAELLLPKNSHRIRGVMSNGEAQDMAFQSSTGGATSLRVIPGSGGTSSGFVAHNNSSPANSSVAWLYVNSSAATLDSGTRGSGTLLPLAFSIGGTQRWQVDTSGRLRDVSSSMPFLSARRDASNQYGGTVVDFDGAFQQIGGANFNDTTNRFTVPVSGVYGFGASAQWYNQGAASSQAITLYNVTGSYVIDTSITGTVASNSWGGANLGGAIYLTAGDQVEVRCNVLTGDFYISKAYFSIYLLR